MKASPTQDAQLEPRPPLERLRERVLAAASRLGNWSKRLLPREQPPAPAVPERAGADDGQPVRSRPVEPVRRPERLPSPAPGMAGPMQRVAPARASQPSRSQRSYLTEPLAGAAYKRDEPGSPAPAQKQADQVREPAFLALRESSGEGHAGPGNTRDGENEQPAMPTPEQGEEPRRAWTRKLLRGTRSGMLLTLEPEYLWAEVLDALAARLAESPSFFQRSVLSLDTRRRPLQPQELEDLRALLASYEMTFKEVGSDELNDPRVLPSGAMRPQSSGETSPLLAIRPGRDVTDTLLTRRTIRSGQRLQYASSVVIMGDVNAGAEVVAAGDVIVWGALRGTVHAGYPGNEEAVVCALVLAPVQLRIGGLASRPPEDGGLPPQTPEVASVKDGQIVVERWNAGRPARR